MRRRSVWSKWLRCVSSVVLGWCDSGSYLQGRRAGRRRCNVLWWWLETPRTGRRLLRLCSIQTNSVDNLQELQHTHTHTHTRLQSNERILFHSTASSNSLVNASHTTHTTCLKGNLGRVCGEGSGAAESTSWFMSGIRVRNTWVFKAFPAHAGSHISSYSVSQGFFFVSFFLNIVQKLSISHLIWMVL